MKPKSFLSVASVIFFAVAILHVLRLVLGWRVQVGSWEIPLWPSFGAIVIAVYLGGTALLLRKKV